LREPAFSSVTLQVSPDLVTSFMDNATLTSDITGTFQLSYDLVQITGTAPAEIKAAPGMSMGVRAARLPLRISTSAPIAA